LLPLGFSVGLGAFDYYSGAFATSPLSLLLVLLMPLVCVLALSRRSGRAWFPLIIVSLSYEALAGPIDSIADPSRIVSLFDFDKTIWGFNLTGWVQSTLFSPPLTYGTVFLYEMLIPLVVASSVIVWRYRRGEFGKYVTAMLLTSYAAMVTFLLVPTAPPWFDGVAKNLIQAAGVTQTPSFLGPLASFLEPDKFAAFPSLHAAYTIICAYFLMKVDRRLGAVALVITGGTFFSTLYLGQHYLIDLLAGAAYAAVPCVLSERLQLFRVHETIRARVLRHP
jgi:membrane-associated phospholipid phosphatase